jgi:glutamine synthetase
VLLAAGLDGLERELECPATERVEPLRVDRRQRGRPRHRHAPENLLDAVRALEADDVLRTALGGLPGRDYIDYFAECKRREVQAAHEQITPWEIDRYLQLF